MPGESESWWVVIYKFLIFFILVDVFVNVLVRTRACMRKREREQVKAKDREKRVNQVQLVKYIAVCGSRSSRLIRACRAEVRVRQSQRSSKMCVCIYITNDK